MTFVVLFKNGRWGTVEAENLDGAFSSMATVIDEISALIPGDQLLLVCHNSDLEVQT